MSDISALIYQHVLAITDIQQKPVYGHIAAYDPIAVAVRAVIPSLQDPDTGAFVVSPWMPLGTPAAGALGGFQYHPITGAGQTSPTAGEQVLITPLDHRSGVCTASLTHYNLSTASIASSLPMNDPMQPGEMLLGLRGGNYIRIRADGGIDLPAKTLRLGNIAATLYALVNSVGMMLFNSHTHNGGPPPDQQMTAGTHTTAVLKAN